MSTPRIPRRKLLHARIGVFGVGYHAYWPQFDGLFDELQRKLATFVEIVRSHGVEVVDFGIVDDAETAYAVGYEDPSYFARQFKNAFGKTPVEYLGRGAKG